MDVFDAIRVLFRRWYVVLPILIVTAAAAVAVYDSSHVEYTASASIGVAAPSVVRTEPATDGTAQTNPLLSNGGTTLLANLLSIRLQDPTTVSAVASKGGTASYTADVLTRNNTTQLPVVTVTAVGADSASVSSTLTAVSAQADQALASVQSAAGVTSALYAKAYVVQPAAAPVAQSPNRTRSVAVVAVVGVVVAVLVAALLDAALRRRRRGDSARHSG